MMHSVFRKQADNVYGEGQKETAPDRETRTTQPNPVSEHLSQFSIDGRHSSGASHSRYVEVCQ